jgi:hypothetical protein
MLKRSVAVLVSAGVLIASECAARELALIVHPLNPISNVSAIDLREVLLMVRQRWSGGGRIYLLLPESGSPEKEVLLRRALAMTEDELRRHYLGKLYGGEIPAFPRVVASGAEARRIVSRAPNALALVDASTVDATVKVVRVAGRRPSEADYLLTSGR